MGRLGAESGDPQARLERVLRLLRRQVLASQEVLDDLQHARRHLRPEVSSLISDGLGKPHELGSRRGVRMGHLAHR